MGRYCHDSCWKFSCGFGLGYQCEVSNWTDIVAISAGQYHTIGLKKDGTVIAAGINYHGTGQCNVFETEKYYFY